MPRINQPLGGRWPLPEQEKTIRIPVRICTDGQIEYFYGGALPKMTGETIGDLVVPERSITDQKEVCRLQQERVVPFLDSGSVVMLAVDGTNTPAKLKQHLRDAIGLGMTKSHAVELTINEIPLRLRLRGTKPATLESVPCWIPSLEMKAKSLNHAYRLVSEQFEPARISHSGNIFQIGYFNSGDRWISLGDLRETRVTQFEMLFSRTASDVFEHLPEKIGSVLQECWGGPIQTLETLQRNLARCQPRLQAVHNEAARVDIQTTRKLMQEMLMSISDTTPYEHVRLIQAAVKYLQREDDEHDTKSSIDFENHALVVRTIAEAIDTSNHAALPPVPAVPLWKT